MNLEEKTACIIDNGLFVDFAVRLTREFGRVLYWSPWVSAFPRSNNLLIGEGLGLRRIRYPWDHLDKVDLWIFPDVYFSDMQNELVRQGRRVWGARNGDRLELHRAWAKERFKEWGLPVNGFAHLTGMDELREYLRSHENVWVKVSLVRGDMETWKSETYALSEPKLDELEHRLGAKAKIAEFIVEDSIDDAAEVGYDGFTVDGKFASTSFFGFEIKDLGFIGKVEEYTNLPEPIRFVNERLSSWLGEMNYRGFLSTELRVTPDGKPYLIDPCARAGSPPSEIYQEIYDNWGEIIWHGAEGQIVEPNPVAKFGVEAMIHSTWADKNWQAISFPDEIRQFVKLRNVTRIDGTYYVVPTECGLPEIGAVIGLGATLQEAIDHLNVNAAQVKGYFLDIKLDSIPKAIHEIEKAEQKFGIPFTDKLPKDKGMSAVTA